PGTEQFGGHHLAAVGRAEDLDDVGDVPVLATPDAGLVHDVDVDDQVERARDHALRQLGRHVAAVGQGQLHRTVDDRRRAAGVDGADRAAAGRHRLQHGDDLTAPDLAHDDPEHPEAERHGDQVAQRDLPAAAPARVQLAV